MKDHHKDDGICLGGRLWFTCLHIYMVSDTSNRNPVEVSVAHCMQFDAERKPSG